MRRFIAALLLAALSFTALADVHLARYGVQYTLPFRLYNADGTLDVDEVDGGTEVSRRCQGGTNATATNDFADKGDDYEIVLTAAEMQCATVVVTIAATTTEVVYINTVNNASAAIPTLDADVQEWLGTAAATPTVAGVPEVDITHFGGSAGTFSGGRPEVNTTLISGDSAAADELELALDLRGGGNGAVPWLGIHASGTAQAYTAGTPSITLAGTTAFGDNDLNCTSIAVRGATTDDWVTGTISDYDGTSDVATLAAAFPNAPIGTLSYVVWGVACASGGGGGDVNLLTVEGTDATTYFEGLDNPTLAVLGTPIDLGTGGANIADNLQQIEDHADEIGTAGAGLTAADDAVITVIGAAGAGLTAVDDAVLARLPAALISGRMASQVGGYESGQAPLQPTVAGRTLDVTATGGAGIDWANVENPTTALGLTGTTFSLTQQVASVSGAVGSVTAGVTVTTNNDKTGYALSAAGVDAIWDEPQSGHSTPDTFGDYLDSAVSGVSTGGVSVGDIADAVWDEALLGHTASGSAGDALSDAATSAIGNGSGLTSIPWNPAWDPEVQSEAEDAVSGRLEQAVRADAAVLNCEVNTTNFAGSTTTVACALTDRDGGAITVASGDLEGRELLILSGAQIYEGRFINDTTWDAANSELRLTLSRTLPATLADAVTAIVR